MLFHSDILAVKSTRAIYKKKLDKKQPLFLTNFSLKKQKNFRLQKK